jgi:gas vesicle protein
MSNYFKDTKFYHITGPGLIEGKYSEPRIGFYSSSLLNDEHVPVDTAHGAETNNPSNYIMIVGVEQPGLDADEIIAGVYNETGPDYAPAIPNILFHQTSSATRVGIGVAVGTAEVAATFFGGAYFAKAGKLVTVSKFGTRLQGLGAKMLSFSGAAGKAAKAAGRESLRSLLKSNAAISEISKIFLTNPDKAGKLAEVIVGKGFNAWKLAKKQKMLKIISLLEFGAGATANAIGANAASVAGAAGIQTISSSAQLYAKKVVATEKVAFDAATLIPGYSGYEVYLSVLKNYSKFLNPYEIRSWYVPLSKNLSGKIKGAVLSLVSPLYAITNLSNRPSTNTHEMPWYTIEITPTKTSKNYLNKNGGSVAVGSKMPDLDRLKLSADEQGVVKELFDEELDGSVKSQRDSVALYTNKFYLDFWRPIDFVTIVEMVAMLDTANPLVNSFIPQKATIDDFVKKEALMPILEALKKTAQYKILLSLNKTLDPNVEPSLKNRDLIDSGRYAPLDSINAYANLKQIDYYIDWLWTKSNKPENDAFDAHTIEVLIDEEARTKEADDLEDFRDVLKQDVDRVFIDGSIDDNIRQGTNFGAFCMHYLDIFHTLASAWPGSSKSSNSIKNKAARDKKALLVATPNAAKQADIREAQLADQKILKIPFKQTANFERHADFSDAISILDEMRDETNPAFADKKLDVEEYANPAPFPGGDPQEFMKNLAGYSPQQRKEIKEALTKRKDENNKKFGKVLQEIKRLTMSPKFLMAAALTGVKSIFPIKTNDGVIELPDIELESIEDVIRNMLSTQVDMAKSQVINIINTVSNTSIDIVQSPLYGMTNSIFKTQKNSNTAVSFIKLKNNTYNENVSRQLDDIKKIITKPEEQVNTERTAKQDSIEVMRKYKRQCELAQDLQLENVRILGYIKAIDAAEFINTKKTDYSDRFSKSAPKLESNGKKTDSSIKQKNDLVAGIKRSAESIINAHADDISSQISQGIDKSIGDTKNINTLTSSLSKITATTPSNLPNKPGLMVDPQISNLENITQVKAST